jgi:hypothetical protein
VARQSPSFVYGDRKAVNGLCHTLRLQGGTILPASCRTGGAYTLDEPSQASVAVRFKSGGTEYCTVFGGTVKVDVPAPPIQGPPPGKFLAVDAPVPAVCPTPPSPCP